MAADQCVRQEEQAVDDKDPGEKEMPLTSHGKPSGTRNRGPGREGATGAIRVAQHARRVKLVPENSSDPSHLAALGLHGSDREQWLVTIGAITPIQSRMSIEDLQAAHNQNEQTHDIQPMAEAHWKRVSIDPLDRLSRRILRWEGFRCGGHR